MIKLKFNQSMIDQAISDGNQLGSLYNSKMKGKSNWVGLLSEAAIAKYYGSKAIPSNGHRHYDLIINGHKVEVKSKLNYSDEWSIYESSKFQQPDYYMFVRVSDLSKAGKDITAIKLAGFIPYYEFWNDSIFHPKGTKHLQNGYVSNDNHYNIFQRQLTCVSNTTIFGIGNEVQLKLSI
jgi:hypothetical protein